MLKCWRIQCSEFTHSMYSRYFYPHPMQNIWNVSIPDADWSNQWKWLTIFAIWHFSTLMKREWGGEYVLSSGKKYRKRDKSIKIGYYDKIENTSRCWIIGCDCLQLRIGCMKELLQSVWAHWKVTSIDELYRSAISFILLLFT